jgi:hypothetical protein
MAYLGTKPANQVIDSTLIADGTVTTADLANGAVSPAKLSTGAPTWDTSSNVGIGTGTTTGGNTILDLKKTGTEYGCNIRFQNNYNTSTYVGLAGDATGDVIFYNGAASNNIFYTNATERMRIDSSGNLLIGTTAPVYGIEKVSIVYDNSSKVGTTYYCASGTYTWAAINFLNAGTSQVGYIYPNSTSTQYSTSSDYRLKENITPMTGALNTVAQLKPCTYVWKLTGETSQGFIAHELQEVVPECVSGEKDAVEVYVDKDGVEQTRPKYQGIDTSFLVATLTAAIQELKAIVDAQAERIAALEQA